LHLNKRIRRRRLTSDDDPSRRHDPLHPLPDYEITDPPTGANITRTTYRIAGQMVAIQTRTGTAAGTYDYTCTDHLGSVVALSNGNTYVGSSLARYDPFGNFRTTPATTVNPDKTSRDFTGHRHNSTGSYDLGLIYMKAIF
jgi:hypothetical protein